MTIIRQTNFHKENMALNLIPEEYSRAEFNNTRLYHHHRFCLPNAITHPQSCPNCGKLSGKLILQIKVPVEDIENNVAEYQELVKDRTIVYTRKKAYKHATHQTIGLWDGEYNPHDYGHFCRLRCCESYANRKYKGII